MDSVIIIVAIVILILIIISYFVTIYNSLIRVKHNIDKAWNNIDVLLKQRHDELKKLIDTVKGHMSYERDLLVLLTKARTASGNAQGVTEKAAADEMTRSALGKLFAVAENYPNLRASDSFLHLQNRISSIEDQIADRREFYNDSVNIYNIRIEQIPYVFIAGMLNYSSKEYFKVKDSDKKDVTISFD
jgi:LemA protein